MSHLGIELHALLAQPVDVAPPRRIKRHHAAPRRVGRVSVVGGVGVGVGVSVGVGVGVSGGGERDRRDVNSMGAVGGEGGVWRVAGGPAARDRLRSIQGLEKRGAAGEDEAVISLRLSCDGTQLEHVWAHTWLGVG